MREGTGPDVARTEGGMKPSQTSSVRTSMDNNQSPHEDVLQLRDHDQTVTQKPQRSSASWKSAFWSFLEDQWFLIAMGIVIAIASQVQVPVAQQKVKETLVSYICVSIIFFVTGCTLDTKILLQNYSRWKIHLFVQVQCFLLCSALIFGIVSATATNKNFMDPGLLVGFVFMGCVATTMSSNVVMTGQAHGNRELTVVQTTIGNFVAVFLSPALVIMYTTVPTWYNAILPASGDNFAGIYRRVLMQLGLSIYLPLAVGQVTRYFLPHHCELVFKTWKLSKVGSVCMLAIIWQTYDQAFASRAFSSVPASNMIFLVFVSVGIWLLLFGVSFFSSIIWLPKRDVCAITYCVPAKGTAMGVPLSTTIFVGLSLELESKIQIPLVIYQGLQIAFGSILIVVFRRWIDRDEREAEISDEMQINTIDVSGNSKEVA